MDTQGKAHSNPGDEKVLTSVRLSVADHEALQKIARDRHRTMSAQIRAWIDEHKDAA